MMQRGRVGGGVFDPQRPSERWSPWWATVLTVVALLFSAALVFGAARLFYNFALEVQYSAIGVPVGLFLLMTAFAVGGPAVGYLRSRRRRGFVTAMVSFGVVAALMATLIFLAWR